MTTETAMQFRSTRHSNPTNTLPQPTARSLPLNHAPSTLLAALILTAGSTLAAEPIAWKNPLAHQHDSQPRQPHIQNQIQSNTNNYLIVTLQSAPTEEAISTLKAQGLTLLDPLGYSNYFAKLNQTPRIPQLASALSAVSPISLAHKLHPSITTNTYPEWSIVGKSPKTTHHDPIVAAYITLHKDIDPTDNSIADLIRAHDADLRSIVMSINTLVVELPLSKLTALANDPRVQWIEPPSPPLQPTNDSLRAFIESDTLTNAPYNLDGSGVTAFVYDGGTIRHTHTDFSNRVTNIDSAPVHYHAIKI